MAEPRGKDLLSNLIRSRGLKVTPARLLVLDLLDKAPGPRSAAQLLKEAGPARKPDRVTVYRNLEAFYRAGLLERVRGPGRAWLYHLVVGPEHSRHPHFHCLGCGAMECLPPDTVALDVERLREVFPGRVEHLRISLDGVCRVCLAKRRVGEGVGGD